jgi:heme/copper-type cytochrome/quinol oxidase subunit 2
MTLSSDFLHQVLFFCIGLFLIVLLLTLIFVPEKILGGRPAGIDEKKWSHNRLLGIIGPLPIVALIFWTLFKHV